MQNIEKKLMELDVKDSQGVSIISSFIMAIIVILGLLLICYIFDILVNNYFSIKNNKNTKKTNKNLEHFNTDQKINQKTNQETDNNMENIELKQLKLEEENMEALQIQPVMAENQQQNFDQNLTSLTTLQIGSELPQSETLKNNNQMENFACEWKMDKVKQFYKKGEDIYMPASLDGKLGYVGRDYICYRHLMNDQSYISKRGGCMACVVDKTKDGKNEVFAGTNVLSTCVFGSDSDALLDDSIWSRKKCEASCEAIPDKTE